MKTRALIDRSYPDGKIVIDFFEKNPDGTITVVKDIIFETVDPNDMAGMYRYKAPVLLDESSAQVLMDDLWQCGIRPTEGVGSAGAFAAQGRHLEDMRALVFKKEPKS